MRPYLAVVCALSLTLPLVAGLVHADVVVLPAAAAADPTTASKPSRGQSVQAVQHLYGEPSKKHAAVGGDHPKHPAITRWDYPGFSVFFEHGHVVDAVVPGKPPAIQHIDQLTPSTH